MKIPSDRKILEYIYAAYYKEYSSYSKGDPSRATKIYMPIDISKVAGHFHIDNDIIFGRLYYHLEKKYGYTDHKNREVHFFTNEIEGERHCINFPLSASVLAGLQEDNKRFWTTTAISLYAALATLLAAL